ncbi:hypothetical protein [Amycolatopsis suaedae]|uniref:Uncharacterized protein n=1 Tax=Amycolatopsis suaedae TaxID=2510978 RepID=A0A4V2EM69_9PSEU|nr:hypothetical protein [Amycolatopsis suaedae]RZQ64025.1 hypothetical protein EWH70_08450 [Amycolatopsis suaedae]
MTGRTDSTRGGRHRVGAGTWTPTVPAQSGGTRHNHHEQISGSLPTPLISRILEAGRQPDPSHGSTSGLLPLPEADPLPVPRTEQPSEPPKRTKVTLIPAPPEPEPVPAPVAFTEVAELSPDADDPARIYVAPQPDGLSTFDLGSVPASVTPPRTWRKAAWFATVSSGGVVVALLLAGSFLVDRPEGQQIINGWPGERGGGAPLIQGELPLDQSSDSGTPLSSETSGSTATSIPADTSSLTGSRSDTSRPRSTTTPSTTTRPVPQKPGPSRASWEADKTRYWTAPVNQPETLAKQSQQFYDMVTENPEGAHSMTGGELRQQGPDGLEKRYSDVAYFQVKHVDVHQYEGEGMTVSTVEVVHKDGTKSVEKRTLTFGEGAKVETERA